MKKTRLSKKAGMCTLIGGFIGIAAPIVFLLFNNRFNWIHESDAIIGLCCIPFTLVLGIGIGALIGTLLFPDKNHNQ